MRSNQRGFLTLQVGLIIAGAIASGLFFWFAFAAPRLAAAKAKIELAESKLKREEEKSAALIEDLDRARADIEAARADAIRRDEILILASGQKNKLKEELDDARERLKDEMVSGPLRDCLNTPVGDLPDRLRQRQAPQGAAAKR